jgi:hypothetical protein
LPCRRVDLIGAPISFAERRVAIFERFDNPVKIR